MPGELEGSPAVSFAPLEFADDGPAPKGSLRAMMERRFEAYKKFVVRPFFEDHFTRLDRQIVLIDALAAFNAGPSALEDLEAALAAILGCFRPGRRTLVSRLFQPRVDRILFAATKADRLHRSDHDRLERILARMTRQAISRAKFAGAAVDVVALAALRATREATVERAGERLPAVIGTPAEGEAAGPDIFDGSTEVVVFPGDLPENSDAPFDSPESFAGLGAEEAQPPDYRFLRFRPPEPEWSDRGTPILPHVRLDRALQFLFGDRLQ
jgi:hypothetical protein